MASPVADPSLSPPRDETAASPQPQTSAGPSNDILPGDHWTQQPVEPAADNDGDSSYDSDNASSTASLTSSILEYRTIQGRTYHSDRVSNGEYWGPNDDKQNVAMDIIHHGLMLALDGKLFKAPLDMHKVKKVLDVGTGTGLWAIDFADEYPDVEVIGTDISPIQPGWVPPNLFFEIEDMTQPWTFGENTFDFVHMRYLFGSVPDWNALFKEAYHALQPGGFIETLEADALIFAEDGTIADGSPLDQWGKVFIEGGKKFGRSFSVVNEDLQRKAIEAAGFTNIVQWDFNSPITGWSADKKLKEIGTYGHLSLEQDMDGMVLYMFKEVMGWSSPEIMAYIAHLRRQLRDKSVHPCCKLRMVYAQKPFDAPVS
ncbi:secondary metabolism regulator LAE1 [Chaetomidium leptoderma]|uniref:Secondary metabolism regulator LAE1 n=1 Tax=Chaetomidium leptoderma TaxID=669021 RepID=A0AAN6VPA1_9PEZI|nr:secondary metabolism regulator LAE1 [Chaetomidium leptoderma]